MYLPSERPKTSPSSKPRAVERRALVRTAMFELTGNTALITGATGAIGDGIARILARAGRDRRAIRYAS